MPDRFAAARGQRERATLHDVAARAEVSPMTASRAIRGEPGVAAATRERVLAAVVELGYRRNEVARNLRLGRPDGLLGLVVTNLANPFYAQLAVGVEAAATARNMRTLLAVSAGDAAREEESVRDLAARGVDGVVVVSASNTHAAYEPDALGGTPVVLAASPPVRADLDAVILDDFGGAYEATRRLIAAGHERIGFLGLPSSTWTGSERLRGFSAALDEQCVDLPARLIVRPDRDIEAAEHATGRLLDAAHPPTAIFAANNRNTIGAYRAIRARPASIALAGFDDIELADLISIPLTVVAYDAHDLGARAVELLIDRVDALGRSQVLPSRRVVVPVSLVDYA